MRSNKASLAEANRHALAVETESHRSNLVNESISKGTLTEQIRSHKASEQLTKSQQKEINRHNLATENQSAAELREHSRHNLATETETHRNNLATDATNRYISDTGNANRLQTAQIAADSSRYVADTNAQVMRENQANQYAIAQLQSQTSQMIANLNNDTSRYVAELNSQTQRLNTQNTNSAHIQANAATNAANSLIAEKNRTQQYIQNRNVNALEQQRIDLQTQINQVNEEVSRGQLSNNQAKLKVDGLRAILDNVVKVIGILRGK